MRGAEAPGLWDRVLHRSEGPVALLLVRSVVFSTVFVDTWQRWARLRRLPGLEPELWEPVSAQGALRMPQPPDWAIEVLVCSVLLGSLLTLCHVVPRVTGAVAAGAYAMLTMAENSFGKIVHDRQPVVAMALILAFAAVPRQGGVPDWRWGWPVQLCRAVLGVMLTAAGIAKLRHGGLDWVFSENMRTVLVMENVILRDPPLEAVALWVAAEPWRWQSAAAGAVLGELSMLLAVVVVAPKLRMLLVLAGGGTLVGITLLMGLVGFPIVALLAVFVSPAHLQACIIRGRSPVLALAPALGGLTALAVTVVLDAGRLTAVVAPLVLGAATLVRAAASARRGLPSSEASGAGATPSPVGTRKPHSE